VRAITRSVNLTSRSSADALFELFFGNLPRHASNDILVKIASIAVLLENECARNAWPKHGQPDILQPDMSIGYQVGVRQLGKELNLYQDFLKPIMVVANWYPLASKVAQLTAVNLMAHQQDHALASPAQDLLLDEESFEVVWAKRFPLDFASLRLWYARSTGDEFSVIIYGGRTPRH
jgi:hypothetical protein